MVLSFPGSGFTGTFYLENPLRVLRGTTQLWYNFSQKPQHFCRRFLFLCGNGSYLSAFWLFVNLMMREQTLIPGFTSRFCFVKLTFGKMPLFTRRSRAGTSQIISARLSKNGTMVTFASDTSFPLHTSTSCD